MSPAVAVVFIIATTVALLAPTTVLAGLLLKA
jgi:hypothetical protein